MLYRKKPVVIEAIQYKGEENYREICEFVGRGLVMEYAFDEGEDGQMLLIPTFEGEMIAKKGDFIIKGVQGEFYPCKPDIFAQTYEAVYDDAQPIDPVSWQAFRDAGLLWYTNSLLHMFGMAIVVSIGDDKQIVGAYPARVPYRGFNEASNTEGYQKVSRYLQQNIEQLVKEAEE